MVVALDRRLDFMLEIILALTGVDVLRMSMSAGEIYCVPEIHWTFVMVGRGGTTASGL